VVVDMIMKTRIAAILILCSCVIAWADLDIRDITPANAKELGWKIEVHQKKGYIQFTVQPLSSLVTERRDAHLSVRDARKMIFTSLLGVQDYRGAKRYVFAVSQQYLEDSVFELGPNDESLKDETTSYRIHLYKFVEPIKKEFAEWRSN
jgi:hypothetical protein